MKIKMTHIDDVDGLKKKVCRKLEVISSKDAFPGLRGQWFFLQILKLD